MDKQRIIRVLKELSHMRKLYSYEGNKNYLKHLEIIEVLDYLIDREKENEF